MRTYQVSIRQAIIKKTNYCGSNVVIRTYNSVTKVWFYNNLIGEVSHKNKTFKCDNCGFNNACTTARINAIKDACYSLGYRMV